MKNTFLTIIGVAFIVFCGYFFLQNKPSDSVIPLGTKFAAVNIAGTSIKAEISDAPKTRERGLSGRNALGTNAGMLFVFQDPGQYGFWMKDMRFSLDIIGLDAEKKIVWLEEDLAPSTYPQVFTPKSPVKYVFELPAGFISTHHIDTTSVVSFDL